MTGQEICDAVNQLIAECGVNRFQEAINWGDLKCIEVKEATTLWPEPDGEKRIQIFIDEAAPECWQFQTWISEQMFEHYGFKPEVFTEW